ncbi:MAG: glycogen/starch synthase, partial [Treponema sp.]|nr:glycogen/starch synthase [Treponema sp.]
MLRFCIWQVSREYADIAESGGVKNVTASLCEELAKEGYSVYLFIPLYGCTNLSSVSSYKKDCITPVKFSICNKIYEVHFDSAEYKSIKMIFIRHPSFTEKEAVYTYTAQEEKINPKHKKGEGHEDSLFLNSLFQKAVLEFGKYNKEAIPDIIHCQDAMTALVPAFLNCEYKDIYEKTRCIVTIHNAGAGYHHCYKDFNEAKYYTNLPDEVLNRACNNGRIEPLLLAAEFSTLTTVSPYYAKELLDPANEKTDGLSAILCDRHIEIEGITNAIDYDRYNPENIEASLLPFSFSPKKKNILGKYKCRDYFLKNLASENVYKEIAGITRYGYIALGSASDV